MAELPLAGVTNNVLERRIPTEQQLGPERPTTRLQEVIETDALAHPEAWSVANEPLFAREGAVALRHKALGIKREVDENGTPRFIPVSGKAWCVSLYGSHWTTDETGATQLQSTTLERLPDLHKSMAADVLPDERSRTVKLVSEATHEKVGTYNPEDITLWLTVINQGHSPIMATGRTLPNGEREYLTHDFTDFHTSSNMLWGREVQDRITLASEYELKRLAIGREMDNPRQPNGVSAIDQLTCSEQQLDVVDYLLYGPGSSPKERALTAWKIMLTQDEKTTSAWEGLRAGDYLNPEVAALTINTSLRLVVGNLEEFITWYESDGKHGASEEQKQAALKQALVGLVRVSEKLLGVYDGADVSLPDNPPDATTSEVSLPTSLMPPVDISAVQGRGDPDL